MYQRAAYQPAGVALDIHTSPVSRYTLQSLLLIVLPQFEAQRPHWFNTPTPTGVGGVTYEVDRQLVQCKCEEGSAHAWGDEEYDAAMDRITH